MRDEINQESHEWFQAERDEKIKLLWSSFMLNDPSELDDEKFLRLIEIALEDEKFLKLIELAKVHLRQDVL